MRFGFVLGIITVLIAVTCWVGYTLVFASSGYFLNLQCKDRVVTFRYVPAACPKGILKTTSPLQKDGTRVVTVTCQG